MQGVKLVSPARILPLNGCDANIGVEWLKAHNLVQFDFRELWVNLIKDSRQIKLLGNKEHSSLSSISTYGLSNICSGGSATLLGRLYSIAANPLEVPFYYELVQLLSNYHDVLAEPTPTSPTLPLRPQNSSHSRTFTS